MPDNRDNDGKLCAVHGCDDPADPTDPDGWCTICRGISEQLYEEAEPHERAAVYGEDFRKRV